jgi:hypothetical protein
LRFAFIDVIIGAAAVDRVRSPRSRPAAGVVHEKGGEMASFVLGGVMGVLALMGLFVASAARDSVFYTTGLGLFVFCVLFIFVMIHRLVGR